MRNPSRLLSTAALLLVACSSTPISTYEPSGGSSDDSVESGITTSSAGIDALWARHLKGYITDLALSGDGKTTLVALAPNHDSDSGQRIYSVNRFDARGKQSWLVRPSAPVKSLALSRDGALSVVSTYDDRITAYDSQGREAWNVTGTCKPIIANTSASASGRIVCYHDDDAEPSIAFDIFDLQGKKLYSYPIQRDIVALKLSEDERNLVIGLDGGKVVAFDQDFHPTWEKSVPGEIADVAVSSGAKPAVAVLYHRALRSGAEPHIALFDSSGKSLGEALPSAYCEEVSFSLDGRSVIAQGNGRDGQYVGLFASPQSARKSESERWKRIVPQISDNPARLVIAQDQVILGFEENAGYSRKSRLVSLSIADGSERWKVDVKTDEGAYLYADSVSLASRTLVVGSDDGRLSAFRFP